MDRKGKGEWKQGLWDERNFCDRSVNASCEVH
jgi:hypothetical protein